MIYKDFYPFYTSYANPLLYRGEKEQEEEFFLMKSYYPDTARKIQEKVEEEMCIRDSRSIAPKRKNINITKKLRRNSGVICEYCYWTGNSCKP